MPRDHGDDDSMVTEHAAYPMRQMVTSYVLTVTTGPEAPRQFTVGEAATESRFLLGQSAACKIRLSDKLVSRRHAALELASGGLRLSDLGSTNGSRVNGLKVTEALLEGGEEIQVGNTILNVQRGEECVVPLPGEVRFGKVIGASTEMRRLYALFARLAATDISVIIEGETGTGKEVLAESLHDASPRASRPFAVFDCTTVVPNLVESTLFGHERGAFTGATTSQSGLFEQADGGTLFIDEIGDLELPLQAKLLRALERSEIRPVGAAAWRRVDVRVIAATRRNLDAEVQAGRFRDDLFFRLNVARVELPPLRQRQGDIAVLARAFWRELGGPRGGLTDDIVERLEAYDWPGNVRELRNVIAKRVALGDFATLTPTEASPTEQVPSATVEGDRGIIAAVLDENLPFPVARERVLEEFERRYVTRMLEQHGGHVGRAATASGIGRRYFQTLRSRRRS